MTDQVAAIKAAMDRFIERQIADVVIAIVHELTAPPPVGTPRDTGWAAANWVPSIGAPRVGTVGTRAAAERGQVSFSPQRLGLAQIATGYKLRQGSIFVTNNVHYVVKLNSPGTPSRQSPPFFIERAISNGIQKATKGGI